MGWKLVALSAPIEGQTINIERDMVIGRHQQADIVLQASHVSRRHAILMLKEDGRQLWIQDLESSNGTFVNQEKVTEKQLTHRDEINFESIRFQVLAEQVISNETVERSSFEKITPSDEGMPTLAERASDAEMGRDGMPQNINIPKPAPIPQHVEIKTDPNVTSTIVPENKDKVANHQEPQKDSKVGLISVAVIIILIILAWLGFGM